MRKLFPLITIIRLAAVLFAAQALAEDNPNVILVLTDDQGYGDVHAHGNELIDTPVMDKLRLAGARFERFYVSPVCAPTRAALMTGRYYLRTGVSSVVPDHLATMRLDEVTLAEAFRSAGYSTALFGKWHLGKFYPQHPNRQGFTEFFGFRSGASPYYDVTLDHNTKPEPTKGYLTDVLTDHTIHYIEQNREQPFFIYLPYNAPHAPFQVPNRLFNKYKARGLSNHTAAVYGMLESVDTNLGRILAKLDELALTKKTIVLFLSDNGPNGRRYNAGMKGTKGSADEGGVRVPLFILWPGHIRAGTMVEQLTAHIDIFPTLMELCGIKPPRGKHLDGISFAKLLRNPKADWRDRKIYSVRLRESEGQLRFIQSAGVRTNRWRLTVYGDKISLYDMAADPGQKKNVADEHPDLADALHLAFNRWYQDVTRDGIQRFPIPIGYDQAPEVKLEAPDAYLSGNITVKGKVPWDIYWIHNWKSKQDDYVWWDLDVERKGSFEVTVSYAAPGEGTAGRFRVEAAGQILNGDLKESLTTVAPEKLPGLRMPRRTTVVSGQTSQTLGVFTLPKGRYNLYFWPLSEPADGFRLNGLWLRRVRESQ